MKVAHYVINVFTTLDMIKDIEKYPEVDVVVRSDRYRISVCS